LKLVRKPDGNVELIDSIGLSLTLDYQVGVRGLTSNPTIMAKAIAASADYDEEFSAALARGQSVEEAYWDLVIADVSGALAALRGVHDDSAGGDGFVSIEVSPLLAHDTARTIEAVRSLALQHDLPACRWSQRRPGHLGADLAPHT
jgi:transaldolase